MFGLSPKCKEALDRLLNAEEVSFAGFTRKEAMSVLNAVEKEFVKSLKRFERLKEKPAALLKEKEAVERSLNTVRQIKLQVKGV